MIRTKNRKHQHQRRDDSNSQRLLDKTGNQIGAGNGDYRQPEVLPRGSRWIPRQVFVIEEIGQLDRVYDAGDNERPDYE